jgi:hypothetical protein
MITDMATNTFVELDLAAATNLADLTGIEYDLQTAHKFAQVFLVDCEKQPPNATLLDALMTAIIVRYARPFATGVRLRLGVDALAIFTPEQRRKHDDLSAIRDKYVAHSVNAFEESRPIARYWIERVQNEGVDAIECNHHRVIGLSVEDLNNIIELTCKMLEHVEIRLREEKAKLLKIVRQMPLDKVLAGTGRPIVPDTSDPGKRRHPLG